MKKVIIKVLVALTCLILALPLTIVLMSGSYVPSTAELTVENKSGLLIESAEVEFCKAVKVIKNLPAGQSTSMDFKVTGECGYAISVSFQGGKTLNSSVGYVDSGEIVKDTVEIEEERMTIVNREMKHSSTLDSFLYFCLYYLVLAILLYIATFYVWRKVAARRAHHSGAM